MLKLFSIAIFWSAITTLSACSDAKFSSDGFESVKFGMTASQLENIGFACQSQSKSCELRPGGVNTEELRTLFGKPASVAVNLSNGTVDIVTVQIGVESVEMIELFKKSLGDSQVYSYTGFTGNRIEKHYWVSNEGTSIAVSLNLDEKPPQGILRMVGPLSVATYQARNETASMITLKDRSKLKPKDF